MCRNFDKNYLKIANIIAERSYAVRHKVGCLIVKNNQIISDGFNGTPAGFDNCCETMVECDLDADTLDAGAATCRFYHNDCNQCPYHHLVTKPEVLHAEANAITKIAKSNYSSEGATIYITLSPCFDCAKLIIQAGIKRVVFQELYRSTDGIELLKKAGIEVEQIENLD